MKIIKYIKKIILFIFITSVLICDLSNSISSRTYAMPFFDFLGKSRTEKENIDRESTEGYVIEHEVTEGHILEHEVTEGYVFEREVTEGYVLEKEVLEKEITEKLIADDDIDDVLLCQTIYVANNNIDEFSKNSQTSQLFGNNFNIESVLKKFAVGTAVVVTVTVLKKAKLPEPVVCVVAGAANDALKFAIAGAAIGGMYGGATGAANEIDKSGTATAIIGFATATAGLIITTVSFINLVPSGGVSTLTAKSGIKLFVAGVAMVGTAVGTFEAGKNAITKIVTADSDDIDWNNIDWNKVGISSVEKAISNSANGYMLGAIVGTVYGGVEGLDNYHKFGAPYTSKADRIKFLNDTTKKAGKWSGKVGESDYILKKAIKLNDGTKINRITYKNGIPDFTKYAKAEVNIEMTSNRTKNFKQGDEILAEYWSKTRFEGKTWTAREIETYRATSKLTWHEMSNMKSMQLVPSDVNSQFKHFGGVAECNAYDKLMGGSSSGEFD